MIVFLGILEALALAGLLIFLAALIGKAAWKFSRYKDIK